MIDLWNKGSTYGDMKSNITCNPTDEDRDDISKLLYDSTNKIDFFVVGTDTDNSFGGRADQSDVHSTEVMYARSSGFTGWN